MEEFPSNSRSAKRSDEKAEPKKLEKVVTGKVVMRKKPLGKRFKEIFFGDDSMSVAEYIFMDVLIPGLRDTLFDASQTALERKFYGARVSGPRRSSRGGSGGGALGHIQYNRYSPSTPIGMQEEPRALTRRSRATHNFEEILLATRVEAEEVLYRMFDALQRYDAVSVRDLYELVGADASPQDLKWGWTDLTGAAPRRTRQGYLLDLPRPEPLD